jgi:DNA-binding response OmpR family regulator
MSKILIIEDDQIISNIYRNKLAVEGYQVEVAADGEQGLSQIKTWRPDAVLLDLVLPKVSGVDLMKRIRAEADFKTLPIVVFSNTYLGNLIQEAWKAGATKLLSKANCSPKQVIDVVKNVLKANGAGMPAPSAETAANPAAATEAARESALPMSAAPAVSITSANADAEFQADLRHTFIESVPAT